MADSSSLTAPSSTESVKLRFRLHDGTDVGPVDMPLTATVGEVKEAVLAAWPPVRSQLEAILVTINCTRAGASGCCSGSSRAVIVAYGNPSFAFCVRQEKTSAPEGVSGLKLILSGRLLADNGVTLADARCPTDGLVTMHLVMAPPKARRAKRGINQALCSLHAIRPCSDPTNYHLMLQPKKVAVESPASGDGGGPCCCTVQ
jgi:Ubiquitin-2 like Rad60 SUMO-like